MCEREGAIIRSVTECEYALETLGFEASNWWSAIWSEIPSGCSFETTQQWASLETSTSGVGIGRADQIPICKVLPGKFQETHSVHFFFAANVKARNTLLTT